jgi:fructose-1,6-bisphosphatase/inositol monophosphatase family enzyme
MVLLAEGLPPRGVVLPRGIDEEKTVWRVLVDPIDGTRGLMYQKRSAWVLTGVAPNRGNDTTLADVVLAAQTEVPLVKQHLSDRLWAIRGEGAQAERFNRLDRTAKPLDLRPSDATTIAHGFAMVSRFFPGAREELAAIDEEIIAGALGPVLEGKAHCFEDQYICTGGQLYELMAGHDRFNADLRPLVESILRSRGLSLGICCHPYDLCTELIAREAGVIVVDPSGVPIHAPFDIEADVAWAGYANASIRAQIEPLLHQALRSRRLL